MLAAMLIRSVSLLAAGSLLGVLAPRLVQDQKPKPAPAGEQQDQHQAAAKTGVHRTLASLAGDYEVSTSFTPPGGEAMQSKGTAKLTAVLDGRFLLEENEGEMMGTKIKGMRIYGWNAEAKQFEGVWMYTESNAIMRLTGKAGSDRQSVQFEGVVQETADKKMTLDIKAKRNQDGSLVFTLTHAGPDGKGAATLEETYTKKK